MKVLFVVQGEGRGHLTQALSLSKILRDNGHEVVQILVGTNSNREIPSFFLEKTNTVVTAFASPGFMPGKSNKYIGHVRSTLYNVLRTPEYMASIAGIYHAICQQKPDLVINFYEILCGLTYMVFRPKVPEVCIGHQYLFLHPEFEMPAQHKISQKWLNGFTRCTAAGASAVLALSFRPYSEVPELRLKSIPPLLRQEILDTPRHHGDYITGYVLNAGFSNDIITWHAKHKNVRMHWFWDKKDAPEETIVDENLIFSRINDEKFIQSLANCKAYATTGGFESVCEALYMGKPVLMVPAHIEQECNVCDAERQGAGIGSLAFNLDRLLQFARSYNEDVEFRMWENLADQKIMSILEDVAYNVQTGTNVPTVGTSWPLADAEF